MSTYVFFGTAGLLILGLCYFGGKWFKRQDLLLGSASAWLEDTCAFPVDKRNRLVAASGMVSLQLELSWRLSCRRMLRPAKQCRVR